MCILCLLHDVVLTEYLTSFSIFTIFSTPGEEVYKDATGGDVVLGMTMMLRSHRTKNFIVSFQRICSTKPFIVSI